MAILTRLTLKYFGCYPTADLQLAPLSVFVGPNDSGKSTLFKAVMAHREMSDPKRVQDLEDSIGMPRVAWDPPEGPKPSDVQLGVVLNLGESTTARAWSTLHVNPERSRLTQELQVGEQVFQTGPEDNIRPPEGTGSGGWRGATHQKSLLNQRFNLSNMQPLEPILKLQRLFSSLQCYRLDPAVLRRPSDPAKDARVPALGERGEGLATVLSVLSGADWRRRQAIEEQLTRRVPTLDRFSVLPTPEGQHRLVFRLKGRNEDLEASQISDGALLFLAFLTILHHPAPPAVLLVEEPENGVHPGRLRFILRMLRELTEGSDDRPPTSVLLTTHSPYLLDEVRPEEAFFCRRGEDGAATVRRFADIPAIEERLVDYGLGELWTAYGEDELGRLVDTR